MAFPIAALIGGLGSLASGGLGYLAQRQASMYNYAVNMYNMQMQERARTSAIRQAEQNKADARLGYRDAQGNRVQWVPGKGWVTTPGRLQRAQMQEQLDVLGKDLPMARMLREREFDAKLDEDSTRDVLLSEFKRMRPRSDIEIEDAYNLATTRGVNEAFDSSTSAALRSAARTGVTDLSKTLSGLNKQRSEALANARRQNAVASMGAGRREYDAARGRLGSLYGMFAASAGAPLDIAYSPVGNPAEAQSSQYMNAGVGAGNTLVNAFGQPGGEMDYMEPQMGLANMIGQFSTAMSGGLREFFAQQLQQQQWDQYLQTVDPNRQTGNQGEF